MLIKLSTLEKISSSTLLEKIRHYSSDLKDAQYECNLNDCMTLANISNWPQKLSLGDRKTKIVCALFHEIFTQPSKRFQITFDAERYPKELISDLSCVSEMLGNRFGLNIATIQ